MLGFTSVFHYISDSELMVYLPTSLLTLVGGILGLCLKKNVAIFITSFVGAFLIVWFVSFFVGDFPNMVTIGYQLSSNDFNFVILIIKILALLILCIRWIYFCVIFHRNTEKIVREIIAGIASVWQRPKSERPPQGSLRSGL